MLPAAAARIAHDLGLAAWFGGATMGAVAMNAATREVEDHTQRLRVANGAWFRWAPVVGVSLVAHIGATLALSAPLRQGRRAPDAGILGIARTAATAAAVLATAGTGWWGRKVVRAGDVPVASAVQPIADTPDEVARAQDRLRVAQWLVPFGTGAILVVDALQRELAPRRPLLALPGGDRLAAELLRRRHRR